MFYINDYISRLHVSSAALPKNTTQQIISESKTPHSQNKIKCNTILIICFNEIEKSFFFIKSLARQNCLQPCGRNRPFAYIESGLDYQTRTGIRTSPSGVLRFKHRVTIILT